MRLGSGVTELIFDSKKVALSIKGQLLKQRLFDKIELVEDVVEVKYEEKGIEVGEWKKE